MLAPTWFIIPSLISALGVIALLWLRLRPIKYLIRPRLDLELDTRREGTLDMPRLLIRPKWIWSYKLCRIELLSHEKFDICYKERFLKYGSSELRDWVRWWTDEHGDLKVKVAQDLEPIRRGSIADPIVLDFVMDPPPKPGHSRKITCRIDVEETRKIFEEDLIIEKPPR